MDIMDSIRAVFRELVVPEFDRIKEDNREVRAILELTNKRLDDLNTHLADQSRRIDSLRDEVHSEIKEVGRRIDETNKRIDSVREELSIRTQAINERIDRLYEVIVRREEHSEVVKRLQALESEVAEIKRKLAA